MPRPIPAPAEISFTSRGLHVCVEFGVSNGLAAMTVFVAPADDPARPPLDAKLFEVIAFKVVRGDVEVVGGKAVVKNLGPGRYEVRLGDERRVVEVAAGKRVMQSAIAASVDGIVAECGGQAMCATCHVYVDDPWLADLPPVEDEEDEIGEMEAEAEERTEAELESERDEGLLRNPDLENGDIVAGSEAEVSVYLANSQWSGPGLDISAREALVRREK